MRRGVLMVIAICAIVAIVAAPLGAQLPGAGSPQTVGFRADVGPDTVYVGQQATYTLTVRIPTEIRQRLRRNPEFVPPESRAMLSYDLPLARTPATEEEVEIHVFRRALFPLTPGRYAIPAARLSYALPQSASFFSREEERTMRSDPVAFVAIAAPTRGRPGDWLGAVGAWDATVRADAENARVGDSFVLVLRLQGEGNAVLLPRPALTIPWADVVVQDERIVLDSTPTLFRGAKEFSWLVTPRLNGIRTISPIEYPFFDPAARLYRRARSAPLRVVVRQGDYVEMPMRAVAKAAAPLPIRSTLAGPRRVRLPGGAWWIWVAAVAPLPVLVGTLASRMKDRSEDRSRRSRVRGGTLRAKFGSAIQDRTGIALAAVTAPGELSAALRLEGVTAATAEAAEVLRDAFDVQTFARRPAAGEGMVQRAAMVLERIDLEARRRTLFLLLLALLLNGCFAPTGSIDATRAFAEGATAYVGGDPARARDAFHRSALAAPRDPHAWANFGTAAWQAGDTAAAVQGWQRALRLSPRDAEIRARLSGVRAPQTRGVARVWPISPLPLAAAAFALWIGAWFWWGRRSWRARPAGLGPRLLLMPAVALASLALWAETTVRAEDLTVIAIPSPLLALPALGADPGAVPLVGEVARILERRGVWFRIELDGNRTGWYPADRTHPLARD